VALTSGAAHLELAEATSSNAWFNDWKMLENGSIEPRRTGKYMENHGNTSK
jgi:hypothetical protein